MSVVHDSCVRVRSCVCICVSEFVRIGRREYRDVRPLLFIAAVLFSSWQTVVSSIVLRDFYICVSWRRLVLELAALL